MTEIVCSGALFYAKSTKRFMLVQRANKKHLGQWGIVGGKAEGKELPVEALKREISEEIGDTPTIKKFIPLSIALLSKSLASRSDTSPQHHPICQQPSPTSETFQPKSENFLYFINN